MVSKELLSEVLGKEVTNIQKGCTENELKITAKAKQFLTT